MDCRHQRACISILLFLFLLSGITANSQKEFTIKGTIKYNGSTVPGVNVTVSGSTISTTTRADGTFKLIIPERYMSANLSFSFVGYGNFESKIPKESKWNTVFNGFSISCESTENSPIPSDSDGDGVPDDIDKCPNVAGPAKYNGCPIPDSDGDGIGDEVDKCPDIFGLARYQGCPVADTSQMRIFPIPYPKASAVYTFPWNEVALKGTRNFSSVDSAISTALNKAGYNTRGYYYIQHGFALVTRIEKINTDGSCKSGPERWEIDLNPPRNFWDYLSNFVDAPKGYFRIVVFLVTDIDLTSKKEQVDKKVASDWVDNGYTKLPVVYSNIPFTPNHSVTVLIYEFKKVEGQPATLTSNRLQAKEHLLKSRLADYLNNRR